MNPIWRISSIFSARGFQFIRFLFLYWRTRATIPVKNLFWFSTRVVLHQFKNGRFNSLASVKVLIKRRQTMSLILVISQTNQSQWHWVSLTKWINLVGWCTRYNYYVQTKTTTTIQSTRWWWWWWQQCKASQECR